MLSIESLHKIKQINSGNIYVENIRSVFDISRVEARTLCEMAVSSKLFEKRIGLVCPSDSCHGRIISDYSSEKEIPNQITCTMCEIDGQEDCIYETSNLEKVEFYRLRKV